jgi:hypothetical protein
MSSFLITKKEAKTFEDKISKIVKKTQSNIDVAERSFDRFCLEFYDGRKSEETRL